MFQSVLPSGGGGGGSGQSGDISLFNFEPTPKIFDVDSSPGVKEVRGVAPFMVKSTQMVDGMVLRGVGETLRLECYVDGLPSPTIVWYKVGRVAN